MKALVLFTIVIIFLSVAINSNATVRIVVKDDLAGDKVYIVPEDILGIICFIPVFVIIIVTIIGLRTHRNDGC